MFIKKFHVRFLILPYRENQSLKVSLHLNSFASKNLVNNPKKEQNNISAPAKSMPAFNGHATVNAGGISIFGSLKYKHRSPLEQRVYERTKAYRKEEEESYVEMQRTYAKRFVDKAAEFANDISDKKGHDKITQQDRVDAIRNNIRYLLVSDDMTTNLRFRKKDGFGNPLPNITHDFDNYCDSFALLPEMSQKASNYFDALVKVLKEDFPVKKENREFGTINGVPADNLKLALHKYGVDTSSRFGDYLDKLEERRLRNSLPIRTTPYGSDPNDYLY